VCEKSLKSVTNILLVRVALFKGIHLLVVQIAISSKHEENLLNIPRYALCFVL